jgi:hypothetical protein
MKNAKEKADSQQETTARNLKTLYQDALYWHLIHKGYTTKRAELARFWLELTSEVE